MPRRKVPSPHTRAPSLSRGAGKNHRIDIKLTPAGPAGSLDLFSDSFTFHLRIKKATVTGSAIVSGPGFAAELKWRGRDRWKLKYLHEGEDSTMSIYAALGKVTKTTNLFGVRRKDPNHDLLLSYSKGLGLHGRVKAKSKSLSFGLSFARGGATSVELEHKGSQHHLKGRFYADGGYELVAKIQVHPGYVKLSKARDRARIEVSFSF